MSMKEAYDLVVIGAGPAGTTMATVVKKYNPEAKVLIIEKSPFPRHHIGESLLPGMIPVLKEMGVFDKINAVGFPKKFGVVFVWGKNREPWDADFNNLNLEMLEKYGSLLDTEFSWQVLRSRYDEILLDHARECGAEAWMGFKAVEPVEKGGEIRGLIVESPEGRRIELASRMLADCSGQNGFLSRARRTRQYREDLKNIAGYAYFKGARWKFEYAGHPDKTKIFVCSTPQGWFWYIPLSRDMISVGLVSKADYVRERKVSDFREFFFESLRSCSEIWPLLEEASLMRGVDPTEPEKDFFTAGDWSYANENACGPGWLAAGDAAFFLDPLLSSGVMMAHISGHRAAYALSTAWRLKDKGLGKLLWNDYDRFCKEIAGSFMALIEFWYHNDPNARSWWRKARQAMGRASPLDLSDKMSFVAVASGLTYYFERAYTSQTLLFGASGQHHPWQWEGTKLELKRWTRQILAIVETGFMGHPTTLEENALRASEKSAMKELPDSWIPFWKLPRKLSWTFLPRAQSGRLYPIKRLEIVKTESREPSARAVNPKRILPGSYAAVLGLLNGRRSISAIKSVLGLRRGLPRDIIEGQVFRLLKDLSVLGAVDFKKGAEGRSSQAKGSPVWRLFREGERALAQGEVDRAEGLLCRTIELGLKKPWAYALRGEARRHQGRLDEGLKDLNEAVHFLDLPAASSDRGALARQAREFECLIEKSWLEDRVLVFRAKLNLALGRAAAAKADAERALEANPRQSEALVLRAKACAALGDLASARTDLKKALVIEGSGRCGEG
ncbi:MAG: tryptophan 7-halogenase [Elusimicrobia bacterium]|nr:tryptophan 7-halogenase [Elusimicrobiota bacterium]